MNYTRRDFVKVSALLTLSTYSLQSCSTSDYTESYKELVKATWRHTEKPLTGDQAVKRELIRYSTLAPSSHNTQCWKFEIEKDGIKIHPDFSRRCSVVDPDDHHLFSSLGCATENLVQAANAKGFQCDVIIKESNTELIDIKLNKFKPIISPLFEAIPKRQSTRAEYDGKQLTNNELDLLKKAGSGEGVEVLLFTDKEKKNDILEYVIEGNTIQMNDTAFVEELRNWVRFSDREVTIKRDGIFSRSSGGPSIPRWLGEPLFKFFLNPETENDKYAKQINSSAGIAVFVSDTNDKKHWIESGRCYERFALQATALGIRNAMLNQPVEVSSIRKEFSSYLGIGNKRPDLIVRFGRGPIMPRSLRRPVEVFILNTSQS